MGAAGGEERAGGSELGILNVVLSDEIEDVRNLRFGFREERLGTTTLPAHEETVEEDSNVRTSEFTPGSKESIGRYPPYRPRGWVDRRGAARATSPLSPPP